MIFDILQYGLTKEILIQCLAMVFALMVSFPVHEAAHAFVANKLGDPTAKNLGRITLNPFKHLDLMGTILLFFVGFGWGKSVPVVSRNFKKVKRDMALTALAGPVSNVILALVFLLLSNCINYLLWPNLVGLGENAIILMQVFYLLFYFSANVNITLAVFNLIPIPPLDGSKILSGLLPNKIYYKVMEYERYSMFIIIFLIWTGILRIPLVFLSNGLMNALGFLADLPFSFL